MGATVGLSSTVMSWKMRLARARMVADGSMVARCYFSNLGKNGGGLNVNYSNRDGDWI